MSSRRQIRGHHPATRRNPMCRSAPRLEALEDRRLLATFNPLPSAIDGSPGSLRAAIIQANSDGQDNTINLQAGTYQLTIANSAGQENGAAQGDLDLTGTGHTITIEGPANSFAIIDGGELDRVFQVASGVTAILGHLIIQDGVAHDAGNSGTLPGVEPGFGGGILNLGTTVLNDVVVQLNSAVGGGGRNGFLAVGTGFTAATGGLSGLGGGIYNAGVLTMNQSIARDNTAEGGSGGTGVNNADNLSVGGNGGTALGGGIFNTGALTISQSLIATNDVQGGAGGKAGDDHSDGFPGNNGGNGGDAYGGGIDIDGFSASVMVVDSTIAGNDVTGGTGGQGGMGGQDGNPLTNPGEQGGNGGNGGNAKGGGIAALSAFSLYNTTVAANRSFASFAGQGGPGAPGNPTGFPGNSGHPGVAEAGGIWAPVNPGAPGLLTSVSTLIAMNLTTQYVAGSGLDSPSDVEATFANATDTLLQDADPRAVGITNGVNGDIVGVDPKLGPLQVNGGSTPTMALLPGSPAIDAGSNPLGLTSDQRGYSPRVVGAAADIGAYELGANAPQRGSGGGGGGGGTGPVNIQATVVKIKGHKEVRVTDPATGALKFIVFPFGKAYRGNLQFSIRDVNGDGIEDLIVRRPRGHHKFVTKIFSGIHGSILPSKLA